MFYPNPSQGHPDEVGLGSEAKLSVSICFPNSTIKPTLSEAHSGLEPMQILPPPREWDRKLTIACLLQLKPIDCRRSPAQKNYQCLNRSALSSAYRTVC